MREMMAKPRRARRQPGETVTMLSGWTLIDQFPEKLRALYQAIDLAAASRKAKNLNEGVREYIEQANGTKEHCDNQ